MFKKTSVIFIFLGSNIGGDALFLHSCINFPNFKTDIINILEDSTNYWSEYPKPPRVTESVLVGMSNEIAMDDSAIFYLDQLSFKQYKWAGDYSNALRYFDRMDYYHTLLAQSAHWNPDIRVSALMNLN